MEIRPWTPDDYDARAAIHNAIYPRHQRTVDQMRQEDQTWDRQFVRELVVMEQDEEVVGYGLYQHTPGMFHPRKFLIGVYVQPRLHGQGFGKALYNHLMAELHQHDPITVRSVTFEDQERGVRFLGERGFDEERRFWESRLDVTAWNPEPFAHIPALVQQQGLEIKALRELQRDEGWSRKLFDLICAVERSMPTPEPITHDYERWLATRMSSPDLRPDSYFVALHAGEYVGLSSLWASHANNYLWTGLTGVKPAYRRRGIALALKLRSIDYARQHGHPVIVTDNEAGNRPMLAINERLGFARGVAELWLRKVFQEAA